MSRNTIVVIITLFVNKFPGFLIYESLFPLTSEPANDLCPEPDDPSAYSPILLFKILFNSILPSTQISSNGILFLYF
jgi:hypothetical protein